MGTLLNSFDNVLNGGATNGIWSPLVALRLTAATTAPTPTAGGLTSAQRIPRAITVPSVGAGKTGVVFPFVDMMSSDTCIHLAAIEVLLGSLDFNGNVYTHGSSMGTRPNPGDDSQTITAAASLVLAVIRTTLTATTPALTFSYTNQDGTTGRSGALTLPTNSLLNSAFVLSPHLQNGDTGIRALSASSPNGLSRDTGTVGIVDVYGLLPIGNSIGINTYGAVDPYHVSRPLWTANAGESIGFYRFGTTATAEFIAQLVGIAKD